MENQIITDYRMAPIPIRNFDWTATFEDYEPGDPIGEGATEAEAIAALKENAELLWD